MKILIFILLVGSFVGGSYIVYSAGKKVTTGFLALRWKTTTARIKHVGDSMLGRRGPSYAITVEYTYLVNGTEYSGTTIHPAYFTSYKATNEDLRKKLLSDNDFRIFYNPSKHEESTLCAGFYPGGVIPVLSGLFFLGGSLLFAAFIWLSEVNQHYHFSLSERHEADPKTNSVGHANLFKISKQKQLLDN